MPLAAVTSVKRGGCPGLRSFLKSRPFSGPCGCGVAALEGFLPSICPYDEDVEVAVVVVVEQRDARRHDLRVVELAGHPVEMHEVEAALLRAFSEEFGRGRVRS